MNTLAKRLEYRHLPDGSVLALLHVTMPDGSVRTFEASAHADEVSGLFSGLWHAVSSVAKGLVHVVRKVAASKVFKVAAIALAPMTYATNFTKLGRKLTAATLGRVPGLSAIPAAQSAVFSALDKHGNASALIEATAHSLSGASKLLHADLLHGAGNLGAATDMVLSAHRDALKAAGGNSAVARELLTNANRTRLATAKLAHKPLKHSARIERDPVSAARAGRMLSSEGGAVTPEQLRAAHAAGRVFWVTA